MHTTAIDCDTIVKLLAEDEFGILLLKEDTSNPLFKLLSEKTSHNDRQSICNSQNQYISYHLYPLLYSHKGSTTEMVNARHDAACNLFYRWTAAGYNKHNSKSPYASKVFYKYLEKIEFIKADYMLLMVSE